MSLGYSQRVSVTLSLEKEVKEKIKQLSKESVRSFFALCKFSFAKAY